ncbi:MAG TPA: BTAD domain-containing putative transcriptional regulator [Gemmatimonadaceae bacterium]|nr:BTAD domain-containing putative transcriptional regulator [Gemmatimonadaceae bacterium]
MALLARLAASGDRGVSRDELLASFWPESSADAARHSLDQLLYEMRGALGASLVTGTGTLRLDPRVIGSDVADFLSALRSDELAAAVGLYRGPFLQGFYLQGSPEFERWIESVRAQLAGEYCRALETLAKNASAAGRHPDAAAWSRQFVAADPLNSRATLGLMRALADAGDRVGALECARVHERIVRAELETSPDPAVVAFAEKLRAADASWPLSPARAQQTAAPAAVGAPPAGPITIAEPAAPAPPRVHRHHRRSALLYLALTLVFAGAVYGALARGPRGRPVREVPTPRVRQQTANIAAYELYVRGRDPTLLRSDSGVRAAIDYLSRAIALDTAYAAAYAALAYRCATATWGSNLSVAERRGMYARAAIAARTAVALDDSLAEAHRQLGYVKMVGYDVPGAIAALERAIALDPNAGEASEDLAKAYEYAERPADAVAEAQRAVRANPLSASANAEFAYALYFARRYDEALAEFARVAALQPPLRRTPRYIAETYAVTGRWKDAIAALRPVAPRQSGARSLLGYVLARSGARTEAERILREMLAAAADSGYAFDVAEIYAGFGDFDRAFLWLDRSFDDYSFRPNVMGPLFDELRADPRFNRLRRRLGTEKN